MPPALLDFERKQFCDKLRQVLLENPASEETKTHIERMLIVVEKENSRHISDAFAEEKLIPSEFHASALKAEHLAIGQTLNPESFAVIIYDSVTMNVDPWENIKLRGWEEGSPTPEQMLEMQLHAEEIALDLERMINRPKPYLHAAEKIKQSGLLNSLDESVNALIHPLLHASLEDNLMALINPSSSLERNALQEQRRAKLSPALSDLIEKYGETEIAEILIERFTTMATKKHPEGGFKQSPAAEDLSALMKELGQINENKS